MILLLCLGGCSLFLSSEELDKIHAVKLISDEEAAKCRQVGVADALDTTDAQKYAVKRGGNAFTIVADRHVNKSARLVVILYKCP